MSVPRTVPIARADQKMGRIGFSCLVNDSWSELYLVPTRVVPSLEPSSLSKILSPPPWFTDVAEIELSAVDSWNELIAAASSGHPYVSPRSSENMEFHTMCCMWKLTTTLKEKEERVTYTWVKKFRWACFC